MFISTEEEQISLPPADDGGRLSTPVGSSMEVAINGGAEEEEEAHAPPCTDVNVVPEHEKSQLEDNIMKLEEEIVNLRLKERSLDEKRREALNRILDIKGCIRVFCRVRPFLATDRRRIRHTISVESDKVVIRSGGTSKDFGFDKVFHQEASQEDVFVEVQPILRSALDGYNVCVLAYGQTGTGKTFSMEGSNESPGIIPLALEELFCQASVDSTVSYTFSISMLEVYLGSVRDLLVPRPSSKVYSVSRCNLNIQTDPKGSVEIEGLTEVEISNFVKANWWYNKGRRVRSTSWTNVNESSSRSHCLTRITIYRQGGALGGKAEVSKMWMVDLGGSERLLKTGATGQTLDEGKAINLSLSALGDVIAALKRKRGHVPYRNSKLTQILKDSLGDRSKVLMLVHVSPYEEDVGETTCSFSFSKRARAVECNRELSVDVKNQREKKIAKIEEEMKEAEEECLKLRNQIKKAEFLLSENKKLFLRTFPPLEEDEEERTPLSPKQHAEEATETPKTPAADKASRQKTCSNSLPRFMSSTVASRQRRCAAETETDRKVRSVRSWNRSSIQMSGSQSISNSDPRYKAFLRNANKKSRYSEPTTNLYHRDQVSKSSAFDSNTLQGKPATPSDPRSRVKAGEHRRRMSDII